ncbi:hypothetical protein Dimus_013097 [Dionaea muscipula]
MCLASHHCSREGTRWPHHHCSEKLSLATSPRLGEALAGGDDQLPAFISTGRSSASLPTMPLTTAGLRCPPCSWPQLGFAARDAAGRSWASLLAAAGRGCPLSCCHAWVPMNGEEDRFRSFPPPIESSTR